MCGETGLAILSSERVPGLERAEVDTMESFIGLHLMAIHDQALAHPAAVERLAREASAPPGYGWMVLGCRWLCRFGRLMAAVGERLHWAGLRLAGAMEKRAMAQGDRGAAGRRATWKTVENG